MDKHSQGGWRGGGGDNTPYFGPRPEGGRPNGRSPRMRSMGWVLAGAALIGWSRVAWLADEAADGVTAWLSTNNASTLSGVKDLAALSGVGKEAALIVKNLGEASLVGQGAGVLRGIAKPAVVAIWAFGAFFLILAPFALSRLGGVLARSRRGGFRH